MKSAHYYSFPQRRKMIRLHNYIKEQVEQKEEPSEEVKVEEKKEEAPAEEAEKKTDEQS